MQRIVPPLFALSVEKKNMEVMRKEWVALHREESDCYRNCPCGKNDIVELCWIKNMINEKVIFVGNCCVEFVAEKGYCARCHIYPVVSHAAHYCERCGRNRKDAPSGFVTKGKPMYGQPIVGLTYEQALLKNPTYARYIRTNEKSWKYNDPHYLQYLKLTEERNSVRSKRTTGFVASRQGIDDDHNHNNGD